MTKYQKFTLLHPDMIISPCESRFGCPKIEDDKFSCSCGCLDLAWYEKILTWHQIPRNGCINLAPIGVVNQAEDEDYALLDRNSNGGQLGSLESYDTN